MPTPTQSIPYLQLDFSAPKRRRVVSPSTGSVHISIVTPPSDKDFFSEIAKEETRNPLILSVIEPYNEKFLNSKDHLPQLLTGIFKPDY